MINIQLSMIFISYSLLMTGFYLPLVKSNGFPGVIELVDYNNRNNNNNNNNRQARMKFPLQQDQKVRYVSPPMKKQRADIETVKQNIEEYNKLLKIDTKRLSEQQKVMLERIVERVARLKETLDIDIKNENNNNNNNNNNATITTLKPPMPITATTTPPTSFITTSNTVTSNLLDKEQTSDLYQDIDNDSSSVKFIIDDTTILPQTTDNLYVTTNLPTTMAGGRSALTTTIQQSDEARANLNNKNNMKLSTLNGGGGSGGSRTTIVNNKLKNRLSTTKKPSSQQPTVKPTSKWIITTQNHHHHSRPSSSSSSLSSTSSTSSIHPTISTFSSSIPTIPFMISTTQQSTKLNDATNDFTIFTTNQPTQQQQQQNKFPNYNKDITTTTTTTTTLKTTQPTTFVTDDIDHSDELPEQKTISTIDNIKPAIIVHERTPIGNVGSMISSDLIYDTNMNSTSIIDSLSNQPREDYYNNNNNKASVVDSNKEKKPAVGTGKPTKYHYYPHNQHIYLLPECAIQQVCNAVYVRLNYTQPLCACPSRYRDPCSASLNEDDQHTTKLIGDIKKKAITLAKTCEATTEMRECRSPKDWSLLALQNTRTGKSHYLVICRCPDHFKLEGPMAHDQPTYASVPGIRVFGMMCVKPGYSVRKPSVQPPKRYQLQKPYYISNSNSNNKYNVNKENRPLISTSSSNGYQSQQQQHQQDSYQLQHQANYQYLNRPDNSPVITTHTEYPNTISLNSFSSGNNGGGIGGGGGYGRNNERKGEIPIEANEGVNNHHNNNNDDDNNNDNENNDKNDNDGNDSARRYQREKRSLNNNKFIDNNNHNNNNNMPEFPWDKLVEFQQSVVWDD